MRNVGGESRVEMSIKAQEVGKSSVSASHGFGFLLLVHSSYPSLSPSIHEIASSSFMGSDFLNPSIISIAINIVS